MCFGRDTAGQVRQRAGDGGLAAQRGGADDGDGVVRREVVAGIFECDQVQRRDQRAGRVTRHDIDLPIGQRAIDQRELHPARLGREAQAISGDQARIAVLPLEKLVSEPRRPPRP